MLTTLTEDDWAVLIYDSWHQTQKRICLHISTAVEPPNLFLSMESALNLVFDFETLYVSMCCTTVLLSRAMPQSHTSAIRPKLGGISPKLHNKSYYSSNISA